MSFWELLFFHSPRPASTHSLAAAVRLPVHLLPPPPDPPLQGLRLLRLAGAVVRQGRVLDQHEALAAMDFRQRSEQQHSELKRLS